MEILNTVCKCMQRFNVVCYLNEHKFYLFKPDETNTRNFAIKYQQRTVCFNGMFANYNENNSGSVLEFATSSSTDKGHKPLILLTEHGMDAMMHVAACA